MYDIERPYGPLVETTVRLVSWNVWGRYGPWEMREQAITGTLGPGDPDIVALAEAWESEQDGQCARLGEQLGLPYHAFVGEPGEDGVRSGIAVLSRWPILHHADQRLGDREGYDGGRVLLHEPRPKYRTRSCAHDPRRVPGP
jgi:endonuclease/exonuclease/phosphatase family metal-dependent hydrolase